MGEERKGMLTEESGKPSSSRIMAFIIVILCLVGAGITMVFNYKQGQPVMLVDIPYGWGMLVAGLMGINKFATALAKKSDS